MYGKSIELFLVNGTADSLIKKTIIGTQPLRLWEVVLIRH